MHSLARFVGGVAFRANTEVVQLPVPSLCRIRRTFDLVPAVGFLQYKASFSFFFSEAPSLTFCIFRPQTSDQPHHSPSLLSNHTSRPPSFLQCLNNYKISLLTNPPRATPSSTSIPSFIDTLLSTITLRSRSSTHLLYILFT